MIRIVELEHSLNGVGIADDDAGCAPIDCAHADLFAAQVLAVAVTHTNAAIHHATFIAVAARSMTLTSVLTIGISSWDMCIPAKLQSKARLLICIGITQMRAEVGIKKPIIRRQASKWGRRSGLYLAG